MHVCIDAELLNIQLEIKSIDERQIQNGEHITPAGLLITPLPQK